MPEPRLHHLERELEPTVDLPVDAPRRVEMAEAVQALVLGAPVPIDDAAGDLGRVEAALDDAVPVIDVALAVREGEAR